VPYGGLDSSCIERVVWLRSACPWRALGGAEFPAVRLCMGGRTGQGGGAIGSVVIYKERAGKNEDYYDYYYYELSQSVS